MKKIDFFLFIESLNIKEILNLIWKYLIKKQLILFKKK